MILDTSAVVAILFDEPEAAQFVGLVAAAERPCDTFLHRAQAVIEPLTLQQAILARQAFYEYGKGRHPAGLNYGDCFAYALARMSAEPLLFKGNDFRQTDITPAA